MATNNQTVSPSQRLGGGGNVGVGLGVSAGPGRGVGAKETEVSSQSVASRLGGGRNIGTQKDSGKRPVPAIADNGSQAKSQEKLGGIFWWLLLGLMIISDIGCVLLDLLEGAGIAIAGGGSAITLGLGAPVAIPLGFSIAAVGWAGGALLSLNAFMFSTGYYLYNKVPLGEARKLATIGVSAIIKLIPMINMFPTLTISFIAVTVMENMKRGKGIFGGVVGTVAKKTIAKAGPVGAVAGKVLSKA